MGGVKINNPRKVWIGENVTFDTNFPFDIEIEDGAGITVGCVLLTHYLDTSNRTFTRGKIHLCTRCYIGCNTIICKPVTIGEHSIIAAGSVVIKDVPPYELWGGNPARFIRKLPVPQDTRK